MISDLQDDNRVKHNEIILLIGMISGAIPQDRHDTSAGAPGADTLHTTPPHSGEPAMTASGPDDGAEPQNASASEGGSFVVGPRSRYVLPPAPQFSKN